MNASEDNLSHKRKRDDYENSSDVDDNIVNNGTHKKRLLTTNETSQNPSFFLKNPNSRLLEDMVRDQTPTAEMCKQLNIQESSLKTYLYILRADGRLTLEDTEYLNVRDERHHEFSVAVKNTEGFNKLVSIIGCDDYPLDKKKSTVNKYIATCFKIRLLNASDGDYLKQSGTKITKNGLAKKALIEYLERICIDSIPTNTVKELNEKFAESKEWKALNASRSMKRATFFEHMSNLIKDKQLSPQALTYYDSCKANSSYSSNKKTIVRKKFRVNSKHTRNKDQAINNQLNQTINKISAQTSQIKQSSSKSVNNTKSSSKTRILKKMNKRK